VNYLMGGELEMMEVVNSRFLRTIPIPVVVLLASCTAAQERPAIESQEIINKIF
jgi:hypothetical protein